MTRPIDLEAFAQSLRVSHCSRGDADHPCVGTCTITPRGVELDCKLCGSDKQPIEPNETLPSTRKAKRIVEAAGLDWSCLSDETKRAVVATYENAIAGGAW
jgi:hypothetical protein